MFAFECVIDDGTYDDFKECVLAIVCLPPLRTIRKLKTTWTCEVAQDLVAMYSISADAVLVTVLTEAMKHEVQNQAGLRPKTRPDWSTDRRGGESVLHQ